MHDKGSLVESGLFLTSISLALSIRKHGLKVFASPTIVYDLVTLPKILGRFFSFSNAKHCVRLILSILLKDPFL